METVIRKDAGPRASGERGHGGLRQVATGDGGAGKLGAAATEQLGVGEGHGLDLHRGALIVAQFSGEAVALFVGQGADAFEADRIVVSFRPASRVDGVASIKTQAGLQPFPYIAHLLDLTDLIDGALTNAVLGTGEVGAATIIDAEGEIAHVPIVSHQRHSASGTGAELSFASGRTRTGRNGTR